MGRNFMHQSIVAGGFGILSVLACCLLARPGTGMGQEQEREPPAQAKESGLSPELAELVAAHNRERAAANLPPLTANPKLTAAASVQARDMAEHQMLSHEGSDGSKFNERIERQGYQGRRMAENIAMGQDSVEGVMKEWMNSPHHRENILGPYKEIGVAYEAARDGNRYWATTFGLPRERLDPKGAAAGAVEAVNRARSEAGKPPLRVSPKLSEAAQEVAESLAALGDLQKAQSTYVANVKKAGYRYRLLGEAAASGQPTPDEVVKSWLGEQVHRENFLGKFSEIGVGYATSEKGVPFWVAFLAQPLK